MTDSEERAKSRRANVEVKLYRTMAEHDADDPAYWAKLSPNERVELAWELSEQLYRMRGEFVDDTRLRRSAVRIIRR